MQKQSAHCIESTIGAVDDSLDDWMMRENPTRSHLPIRKPCCGLEQRLRAVQGYGPQ